MGGRGFLGKGIGDGGGLLRGLVVRHCLLVSSVSALPWLRHCQQVDSGTPFAFHATDQGHLPQISTPCSPHHSAIRSR